MFRFALAVFKSSEELLLKCEDHMSIFNFLRQVPEKITDANILSQVSDSSYAMWHVLKQAVEENNLLEMREVKQVIILAEAKFVIVPTLYSML